MNIMEFAINMEIEGYNYYSKQAQVNKDNGLKVVFEQLAQDEKNHADLLKQKSEGATFELTLTAFDAASHIFSTTLQISDINRTPEQLDLYHFALAKEEESITLYKQLLADNDTDTEFFEYLIEQETQHFQIVSNIVDVVSRPKDWVESAEFGVREDY